MLIDIPTDILEGTTSRYDCPSCGGVNTLSVSKRLGTLLYNCYSASCDIKGIVPNQYTIDDLKLHKIKKPLVELPQEDFKSIEINTTALQWLTRYNSYGWKKRNPELIKYDVIKDRIVFLIKKNGKIVDGVGALLGNPTPQIPKWYRYGDSSLPFVAERLLPEPPYDCIVVEDAASACAASAVIDGIALLGVNATSEAIIEIARYEKAYIALDRDALSTTWSVAKKLNQVVDTEVLIIDKDLKYYNSTEMLELLEGL